MRQQNGTGWCICPSCDRTFGGITGFDLHRMDVVKDPYDWRCGTDAELRTVGLHRDGRGWWRQDGRSTPYGSTEKPEHLFDVPRG